MARRKRRSAIAGRAMATGVAGRAFQASFAACGVSLACASRGRWRVSPARRCFSAPISRCCAGLLGFPLGRWRRLIGCGRRTQPSHALAESQQDGKPGGVPSPHQSSAWSCSNCSMAQLPPDEHVPNERATGTRAPVAGIPKRSSTSARNSSATLSTGPVASTNA